MILSNKAGLVAVNAKFIIDCTGDADVAARSGVETWFGDKDGDGTAQPASLQFEVDGIDREKYIEALEPDFDELDNNFRNCFWRLVNKARENGEWDLPRNELGAYETNIPGRFKINTTRIIGVDSTDPEQVSAALLEGRRQIEEVFNFIRKYVPGGENAQICGVADQLGVRESRHIVGRYQMTADDVLNRAVEGSVVEKMFLYK